MNYFPLTKKQSFCCLGSGAVPMGYIPEVGTLNYLMLELLGRGIQLEVCTLLAWTEERGLV